MLTKYKDFNFKKINEPEFSHIKLLLYWPFYGIMFLLLERVLPLEFHEVSCTLDKFIPFSEYFIIPYYLWFVYLIGMLLYSFFYETETFKKYMWFIIISYTLTIAIYLVYPTKQVLRPETFQRDNIFTDIVSFLYVFDTNTNVCPSLHVIGMMAVTYAGFSSEKLSSLKWKIFWIISSVFVCLSTVFLKQHSLVDLFAGLLVSFLTIFAMYILKKQKQAHNKQKQAHNNISLTKV